MRPKNPIARGSRLVFLSLVALAMISSAHAQEKPLRGYYLHGQPGPGEKAHSEPSSSFLLIQTQQQLDEFVSHLPEELPSNKNPAPPNPDPLRKDYKIDFSKNVLVVALHRDTISAFPEYQGCKETKRGGVVKFDIPSPPPEARPYGWGVYTAVLMEKGRGPFEVELTDVKGDW